MLKNVGINKVKSIIFGLCIAGAIGCGKTDEHRLTDTEIKAKVQSYPKRDITSDSQVQKYLKDHKVYISLTTSPTRISKIDNVLDTLELEYIENILINLPLRFGRDDSTYKVPFELIKKYNNKVLFLRPPKDLGPITKLLPSTQYIKEQGDKDAILISIDDDTAYPRGMVNEMIQNIVHHPHTVIASSGQDLRFWNIDDKKMPIASKNTGRQCRDGKDSYCDVVEGFGSIGYRVGFIHVDLMKKLSASEFSRDCFVSDDLVISFSLALSGIDRLKISNKFLGLHRIHLFSYGFEDDALHKGAGLDPSMASTSDMNNIKYQNCHAKLIELTYNKTTAQFNDVNQIIAEWNQRYLPTTHP